MGRTDGVVQDDRWRTNIERSLNRRLEVVGDGTRRVFKRQSEVESVIGCAAGDGDYIPQETNEIHPSARRRMELMLMYKSATMAHPLAC